jgi:hypothetical protein
VKRPQSDARTHTFHGSSGGGSSFSALQSEPITPGAQRLESKICEGGFGNHRFLRPITSSAKNNPARICGACIKRMRREEVMRSARQASRRTWAH